MAQVIDGGPLMFDALAYGQSHPNTQTFVAAQFDTLSNTLTDAGQRFMAGAADLYERLSGSTAMRMLRAASRSVRSIWQTDQIQELIDVGQFQHAPLSMQRWIMAEPTVRTLWQQQRLDGYSDTYFDTDPGAVGVDHYDYRRVMNGVLVETDKDWEATTYLDELLPDDTELSLEEQVDILSSWDAIRALVRRHAEDPTSRYNADIG